MKCFRHGEGPVDHHFVSTTVSIPNPFSVNIFIIKEILLKLKHLFFHIAIAHVRRVLTVKRWSPISLTGVSSRYQRTLGKGRPRA